MFLYTAIFTLFAARRVERQDLIQQSLYFYYINKITDMQEHRINAGEQDKSCSSTAWLIIPYCPSSHAMTRLSYRPCCMQILLTLLLRSSVSHQHTEKDYFFSFYAYFPPNTVIQIISAALQLYILYIVIYKNQTNLRFHLGYSKVCNVTCSWSVRSRCLCYSGCCVCCCGCVIRSSP